MSHLEFRLLRTRLRVSQRRLAKLWDVSHNTICRIERGPGEVRKLYEIALLALEREQLEKGRVKV